MYLDLLLRSAQTCKKCTFLKNLRTISQKGNKETRQMIPFFHLLFLPLLFVIFTSEFENIQNWFSCSLFSPVKYLNLWTSDQRLPIWTPHHTFLESRHPEVTKNLYYVLSTAGAKYLLQSMYYNIHWCSRYMLLLNVNRINQTGFFQTYLHHHSLHQCYPLNFHMIYLCTRHTQTYILNHVFDMNINFYVKQFLRVISVLILELLACQFW